MMEVHPIAAAFPLMSDRDFRLLTADIRVNGLRVPIVTLEGKIVDGRHRHDVCADFGIPMQFVELPPDTDVARYVVSVNATRRHLKPFQRAEIAARLATLKVGRPGQKASFEAITQRAAAQALGISRASVQRAVQRLAEGGPKPQSNARPPRSARSSASPSLPPTGNDKSEGRSAGSSPTSCSTRPSSPQPARHFAARIADAISDDLDYAQKHEVSGIGKWSARERQDALTQLSALRSRLDQLIAALEEASRA